eukprot:scaffold5615_cov103-Isochrysis_galbana.AAC.8
MRGGECNGFYNNEIIMYITTQASTTVHNAQHAPAHRLSACSCILGQTSRRACRCPGCRSAASSRSRKRGSTRHRLASAAREKTAARWSADRSARAARSTTASSLIERARGISSGASGLSALSTLPSHSARPNSAARKAWSSAAAGWGTGGSCHRAAPAERRREGCEPGRGFGKPAGLKGARPFHVRPLGLHNLRGWPGEEEAGGCRGRVDLCRGMEGAALGWGGLGGRGGASDCGAVGRVEGEGVSGGWRALHLKEAHVPRARPRDGEARAGPQPQELAVPLLGGQVGAPQQRRRHVLAELEEELLLVRRVAQAGQPRHPVGQRGRERAAQLHCLGATRRRRRRDQRWVIREDVPQHPAQLLVQLLRLAHHLGYELQRERRRIVAAAREPRVVQPDERQSVGLGARPWPTLSRRRARTIAAGRWDVGLCRLGCLPLRAVLAHVRVWVLLGQHRRQRQRVVQQAVVPADHDELAQPR